MTAAWKVKGLYKADADKVKDEILAIGDNATAEDILEAARDENSELHKCFEWDDSIAAEKYRLHQARLIVCNIVYKAEPTQPKIRTFMFVDSQKSYVATDTIVTQADTYKEMLNRALRELECFRQKYQNLAELETIFEEIDKAIA